MATSEKFVADKKLYEKNSVMPRALHLGTNNRNGTDNF